MVKGVLQIPQSPYNFWCPEDWVMTVHEAGMTSEISDIAHDRPHTLEINLNSYLEGITFQSTLISTI